MTGKVFLVGAGPGDPNLLTLKAAELLATADLVATDALVSERIVARIPKGTDLYGVTAGLTVTPLPHDRWGSNLKIRPEIRYDASNDPVFNGRDHQFTFGIDAVYRL